MPLSTTAPPVEAPYHCKLILDPPPYDAGVHWVKCDMLYTVSLERLFMPRVGKTRKEAQL